MKTVLEILQLSAGHLQRKGILQPRRQAEELISDTLGINRLQLYLNHDRPLTESELETCRQRLVRRANHEPAQYIHGEVEFYKCFLKVTPDVLIPRQETEILVDKIVQDLSKIDLTDKILWDLCCGSGCIGIAIKKHYPQLKVILSDFSEKALSIAKENAQRNEVDVEFLQGDLLAPFSGQKADFFVCNPPYVSEAEYAHLEPEVRNYEPAQALIAGPTGLEFYERLAGELSAFLHPHAKGWLEIGAGQGERIKTFFKNHQWKSYRFEQDWAGHDRFFFLEIE
jgi:release factor glutamine methyltransferase